MKNSEEVFNEVIARLGSLNEADLKKIQAAVKTLMVGTGLQVENGVAPDREVYQALADVMEKRNLPKIPYSRFRTFPEYGRFVRDAGDVLSFIEADFKPESRMERLLALRLCWGLVLDWMEPLNIPKSYRTACQQMCKMPGIVDESFPGYARAGLLRMVLDQKRKPSCPEQEKE